jgi:O-antigen ligase
MGFLATIGSLFVMGALAAGGGFSGWKRWIPASVAGVAAVAGFLFLPVDPLISRFASLASSEEITSDTRAVIWRESTQLVEAFPLTGCGLGAYESCFLRYKTVAPMNTVNYAHNDYLQIAAELGIPAFLLGMALVLRVFWSGMRTAESDVGPDERCVALACTGSMAAILLHSFTDFNLYLPANAMLMAWVMGIAARRLGR